MDGGSIFIPPRRISELAKFEHDIILGWAVPLAQRTENGEAVGDNIG